MQLQQTLLKIALLGTERQTQAPQGNAALQPYLAQLYPQGQVPNDSSREAAFLGAAALALSYQAAGNVPAVFTGTLPTPDDKPDLPLIPPIAEMHLRRMLADNNLRPLLDAWLERVVTKRLRVPLTFIPLLLEQAQQSRAIRPAVSAVIGQRGHWLANQHPDWGRLLTLAPDSDNATDPSVWEEGNPTQRTEYLHHLRTQQPDTARELLQAVWKQEAAQVRQELLQALRTKLSLADEPWLETCLDDRSKGVRQLAAELLGGLPDSAFSQRMQTRLTSWVTLPVGACPASDDRQHRWLLQVNLPETHDKSWLRDGIEEKPPQGKGAKAWWLEQALVHIPIAFWTQHWQLSPTELLTLALKSDWKDALLTGWQPALTRYPDPVWAAAWLAQVSGRFAALWAIIPPAEAERLAAHKLHQLDSHEPWPLLTQLEHAWSLPFSLQVIDAIQTQCNRSETRAYLFHSTFQHIASHLHIAGENPFAERLHTVLQDENHAFHRLLSETLFTLRFRADMLAALETVPPKDSP